MDVIAYVTQPPPRTGMSKLQRYVAKDAQRIRALCRKHAGAHNRCPIRIVEGDQPPELHGSSYYYTTLSGGTVVRYPNAYGWPTRYVHSTLVVTVGEDWLKLLMEV